MSSDRTIGSETFGSVSRGRRACGALPVERLERVESWGMNRAVMAYVYRPSTADGVSSVLQEARSRSIPVALRGAGRSYGDAALIAENIVLDLSRMDRVLAWDPETGRIEVEPGVTLRRLWQYTIGDGWWPPVVSGTMTVTMGGAAGMNYHGKNNFAMGPIGDHILEFDLLLPDGQTITCRRDRNPELFHAAIGGFGMLGCFTRIALQMKRVHSGMLSVYAFATRSFGHIIEEFETRRHSADYLVGWIDCFARGSGLGRGLVHQARYLHEGEDASPAQTLRVENQELPDTLFGVLPKSAMWRLMKPFSNDFGMRLVNWAKYVQGSTLGNKKTELQSHAGFAFLLDYVPNWKFVYKPGGLIQYQSFVPLESAERSFTRQIELCHSAGLTPYLGVMKRHRKDEFLMTHSVNGYSLALDFPVTDRNWPRLQELTLRMNDLVLESGGRFYFAKDSTLDARGVEAFLGAETIDRFFALKRRCDPESILQTGLAQRLFGDRLESAAQRENGAAA